MYHRFVIKKPRPSPNNVGLLYFIWELYEKNELSPDEEKEIESFMCFFNEWLPAPENPHKGLFWFKEDNRCITKALELQTYLEKHLHVETVHYVTENPGRIVYEDRNQVIGEM